jgi:hypothetical protein
MATRSTCPAWRAVLAAFSLLWIAAPAHAVLGGAPMQPPADATSVTLSPVTHAASMSAFASGSSGSTSSSTQGASGGTTPTPYTVKQTTLSTGTLVREYVSQSGIVFGIAWNGPRIPDLPTLLGSYFPQYVSGVQALREAHPGRGPVHVEGSALVVHSGGHMGSFFGQAWLPQALPAGVNGSDIQ